MTDTPICYFPSCNISETRSMAYRKLIIKINRVATVFYYILVKHPFCLEFLVYGHFELFSSQDFLVGCPNYLVNSWLFKNPRMAGIYLNSVLLVIDCSHCPRDKATNASLKSPRMVHVVKALEIRLHETGPRHLQPSVLLSFWCQSPTHPLNLSTQPIHPPRHPTARHSACVQCSA